MRFHLWVRKIPWSRKWQPILVFLHGKSHGCRRLMGCGPWGQKRVRHDWVTEHTLTPLPPHMHSLLLYQYLPPEWCICYNWWTYIDTSLSLRGLTLGVVHCISLDKCAADPTQCEFKCVGPCMCRYFSAMETVLLLLNCFSRVQLFATPWTIARQPPLSMAFSRQEYWRGLPFPPPGISTIMLHNTWLVGSVDGRADMRANYKLCASQPPCCSRVSCAMTRFHCDILQCIFTPLNILCAPIHPPPPGTHRTVFLCEVPSRKGSTALCLKHALRSQAAWVWILASTTTRLCGLGKLLSLSVPQFPQL